MLEVAGSGGFGGAVGPSLSVLSSSLSMRDCPFYHLFPLFSILVPSPAHHDPSFSLPSVLLLNIPSSLTQNPLDIIYNEFYTTTKISSVNSSWWILPFQEQPVWYALIFTDQVFSDQVSRILLPVIVPLILGRILCLICLAVGLITQHKGSGNVSVKEIIS